jgi:hypothetical protein
MSKWIETVGIEREGFSIKVPEGWWEFEIRPDRRDEAIRLMVEERVRAVPEVAGRREVITSFLREQAAQAWSAGAAYIGCMAEDFGGSVPVTATMTVSLVNTRGVDGAPSSSLPSDVVARLTPIPRKGPEDGADGGGVWREVSTIDIPGVGPAARTRGVEDVAPGGHSRRMRVVLMQTFIPVPGDGSKIALVTGSSQVLDLVEAFLDVFDAVTSTFRFVRRD